MKLIYNLIFVLLFSIISIAQQNDYAVGGGIGIGSLIGNFPSQTTLGGKVFFETNRIFKPFDKLRINFVHAQKIEKFLPGDFRIQYYSLIHLVGVEGLLIQKLNQFINFQEGIGAILINDRTFNDINVLNYGVSLSLLGEINLSEKVNLGLGLDYGLTFNNTNISYFLFLIQAKYFL